MQEPIKVSSSINFQSNLSTFEDLIENENLFEVTRYAKKLGYPVGMRLGVMPKLLKHLVPMSEDQAKGYDFISMLDQVFSLFKKKSNGSAAKDLLFGISVPTFVEKVLEDGTNKVKTRRKAKDKIIEVHATMIPEAMFNLKSPAVLFGLHKEIRK